MYFGGNNHAKLNGKNLLKKKSPGSLVDKKHLRVCAISASSRDSFLVRTRDPPTQYDLRMREGHLIPD